MKTRAQTAEPAALTAAALAWILAAVGTGAIAGAILALRTLAETLP